MLLLQKLAANSLLLELHPIRRANQLSLSVTDLPGRLTAFQWILSAVPHRARCQQPEQGTRRSETLRGNGNRSRGYFFLPVQRRVVYGGHDFKPTDYQRAR